MHAAPTTTIGAAAPTTSSASEQSIDDALAAFAAAQSAANTMHYVVAVATTRTPPRPDSTSVLNETLAGVVEEEIRAWKEQHDEKVAAVEEHLSADERMLFTDGLRQMRPWQPTTAARAFTDDPEIKRVLEQMDENAKAADAMLDQLLARTGGPAAPAASWAHRAVYVTVLACALQVMAALLTVELLILCYGTVVYSPPPIAPLTSDSEQPALASAKPVK